MEKKVKDMKVKKGTTIKDLGNQYLEAGGFVAKKVGTGIEILREMFQHARIKFLSFPACIISTGTRGLIKDLIKNKKFDIVITTCGTLDHDFSRIWKEYYHGSFEDSDIALHRKATHRLGNIQIPISSHGKIIEEKLQPLLQDMYSTGAKHLAPYEFVWELGKRLEQEERKEESLIYWCWKNKIPMLIPGITDGTFGLQLLMFMQDHRDFIIDVWKDEFFLLEKMFDKVKTGALMIGGGISKHHTIWWNQFKDGLDYAVYITTAPEWDGSLSGARMREGISWNKVSEQARFVTIEGDATVILPLLVSSFL
jgi:deoxyhypusine synthase